MKENPGLSNWVKISVLGILFLGALQRILMFFQNRSLFLDEINLSRNIVEKSYVQLFSNLDYQQHAPPFFVQSVKAVSDVLGVSEYSLRLIPTLAGLASLYLFYRLAKRYISSPIILVPVLLFALTTPLVIHQTEIKQYSTDVLFTLLLILLAHHVTLHNTRKFWFFILGGAVSLWFSMPMVFVLPGIGLFLVLQNDLIKIPDKSKWLKLIAAGLIWLLSFLLLYFTNLAPSLQDSHILDFHREYFMEWPTSWANIQHSADLTIHVVRTVVGKTTIPIIAAILFIAAAIAIRWKLKFPEIVLLCAPVFVCLLASFFHFYSLIPRLILFMMPLLILLIGIGASDLYVKTLQLNPSLKNWAAICSVTLFAVLSFSNQSSLKYFFNPYENEESRPVLKALAGHQKNDLPLYVVDAAVPAYSFYTDLRSNPFVIPSKEVFFGHWDDDLFSLAEKWKEMGYEYIWVFDSHSFGVRLEEIQKQILVIGEIEEKITSPRSYAYRIKLK